MQASPDQAGTPGASSPSALYDAFISYKHGGDRPVASGLQTVLQSLGKPWWRRRTMRIFRDDTTLVPSHQLWASIEKALTQSRNLILIASPESADSPWVEKEVAYWLANRKLDSLYIALTAGELTWNAATGDFDWGPDTPLPSILKGKFAHEPLWVDLRPYRGSGGNLGKSDKEFVNRAAGIAAGILGRAKEDLLSEELRQQRRNLTWAWSAAASLAALAAASGWLAFEANRQRQMADQSNTRAQMQLAIVHSERSATPEALAAALDAVKAAQAGGIAVETLESDLYAVSSKVSRGLVAAGRLQWPEELETAEVRQLQFLSPEPALCTVAIQYVGDEGKEETREHCFSVRDGVLVPRPDLKLGDKRRATEALPLGVFPEKGNVLLKRAEPNDQSLLLAVPAGEFGEHLPSSHMAGALCPDLKHAVVTVSRYKPSGDPDPNSEGKDFVGEGLYFVDLTTGKITTGNGAFGLDSVACSPNGRFIAGAPQRGQLSVYDLSTSTLVGTSNAELARFSGNAPGVAFSPDDLVLLPALTKVEGDQTSPRLLSTFDKWSDDDVVFPMWGGKQASVVALSDDSRYAALLYDDEILTLWDLSLMGLERARDDTAPEETASTSDAAAAEATEKAARAVADQLRKERTGDRALSCVYFDGDRKLLFGVGDHAMLQYDLAARKVMTDDRVRFLGKPIGECEGGFSTAGVSRLLRFVNVTTGLKAFCEWSQYTKSRCAFALPDGAAAPPEEAMLSLPCSLGNDGADIWLCALGDSDYWGGRKKDGPPAILVIDRASGRIFKSDHDYFAYIFESQAGFSDFTVEKSQSCPRLLIHYTNWQRGGGVRQPDGAVIMDHEAGRVVAHVHDARHPVYCDTPSLVEHLERLARVYAPTPLTIAASGAPASPDAATGDP